MIYDHDTDTEPPHNIFDEEFGKDTKVLPMSRPITEPTPIAYQIAKLRINVEFGRILQTVTRVSPHVTYDEILLRDRKLREVMDELPPHLRMQPLEGSHDPVALIMGRLNVNILYNKVMCILHKKHMVLARQNSRYAHSRRSSIEASLETLRYVRDVVRECQPNGRLRKMKWYVQATSKDTMLPTMLVLLDLHHENQAAISGQREDSQPRYFWTPEQRQEMFDAISSARDIWKSLSGDSVEAYKGSRIIDIMLAKIKNPDPPPAPPEMTAKPPDSTFGSGYDDTSMQPEESAAMTLGMLSSGLTAPNFPSQSQSPGGTTYPPFDMGIAPDFTPDLSAEPGMSGNGNNPASPFSMFANLSGAGTTMDSSIDWVSSSRVFSLS